jgi:hypothetical protein
MLLCLPSSDAYFKKRTTNLRSFWTTTVDTSKRLEKDYTSETDYDLWFLTALLVNPFWREWG